MATSPSHAPVSPIREFQHERADLDLTNINSGVRNARGIDPTYSSIDDRAVFDVSNHDSSNGSDGSQPRQSSSYSPLAGGSSTCRSRNQSDPESSRISSPPNEPWKQHKSHFRPWLAPSKSNNKESSPPGDASSTRHKPYHLIPPKQHQQKIENDK